MTEAKPGTAQNSVMDDVRRALGRSTTVVPVPLEPFIEPPDVTETSELIARFTAEAIAVRASVYLLSEKLMSDKPVSDKLQFVADDAAASTSEIDKLKFVGQLGELIAEICRTAGATEVAISDSQLIRELGLPEQLASHGLSIFAPQIETPDHGQMVARLANCAVGLTTVDYAIAETGTIVLTSDECTALLVSLLPTLHIALVRASQIEASLDEIIRKVGQERIAYENASRSVTLITGPSRTSDVELVLSIGVHGPKELHLIIID